MGEVAEYLEEEDDGTVFNSYSSQSIVDAEEFEVTDYSESSFLENECALALLELAHSFVFSSYGSCDDFDMGLMSKSKPSAVPSAQMVAPPSLPISAVDSTMLNLKAFNALLSLPPNDCSVIELDHSYAEKKYSPVHDSSVLSDVGVKKSVTISSNEAKVRSRRRRFVESPVAALSNIAPGVDSGSPSRGEMAGKYAGKRTTEYVSPRGRAEPHHLLLFGSRRAYSESSCLDLSEQTVGRNGRRFRRNQKAQSRHKPAKTREARAMRDYCPPKYVKCK